MDVILSWIHEINQTYWCQYHQISQQKGYCLQCFLNSPPGENVNSFTPWWMIYLTREYLIIHLVVKVLTFSPDGESYLLTIQLKVNCFHRSVKSRRSSSYCFVDWRGFIIHPEVNSFHQSVKGLKSCGVKYFILGYME